MDRWWLIGALLFGGVFALFGFFRMDVEAFDSRVIRWVSVMFLFGVYCAIVIFGTAEKKRSLSLLAQTLLGVALACTIAALIGATAQGYILAVALGLVLGFTADFWVEHIRLP